jgi:hypothetical protein
MNTEKLSDAIGEIRDDLIQRADTEVAEVIEVAKITEITEITEVTEVAKITELTEIGEAPMRVERVRLRSLQFAGLAAAMLFVAIGAVVMLHVFAPVDTEEPTPAASNASDSTTFAAYYTTSFNEQTTAEPPYDGPFMPFMSEGLIQFVEYLRQVGSGREVDDFYPQPQNSHIAPHETVGQTLYLHIFDTWVNIFDFYSEELAEIEHQHFLTWDIGETFNIFKSGTVVITFRGRNAPKLTAFLEQHYGSPTVLPCRCSFCAPPTPPTDDKAILEALVQRSLTGFLSLFFFDDINDVRLGSIMTLYIDYHSGCWERTDEFSAMQGHHYYTWEEMDGLDWGSCTAIGVTPALLEAFIREHYNPNFRIESYGYRNREIAYEEQGEVIWDAERGMLVRLTSASCAGFNGGWLETAEILEVGDEIHVYSFFVSTWSGWFVPEMSYIRTVFTRNPSGGFYIMSSQEVSNSREIPDWAEEFLAFYARLYAMQEWDSDGYHRDIDGFRAEFVRFGVTPDMINDSGESWCSHCPESEWGICDDCMAVRGGDVLLSAALPIFRGG